jgi:SAM-dependent methyltransferase
LRLRQLPADLLAQASALEDAYLQSDDPIRQSGFGGGPERWRAERSPILEAVTGDGDFLDIGCANGYLAECLVGWAAERGVRLTPQGIDIGPRLIAEAKGRLPAFADNFHVANGWDWQPGRRFRYVYTLSDCVPPEMLAEYVERLLDQLVEPGGRLIVGSYGSRSRSTPPLPIGEMLASFGHTVAGRAWGGDPPITAFAWVVRQAA